MAAHDYTQAADQLLATLTREPGYRDGAARERVVTLSTMLAPTETLLAQELRRRLGAVLA